MRRQTGFSRAMWTKAQLLVGANSRAAVTEEQQGARRERSSSLFRRHSNGSGGGSPRSWSGLLSHHRLPLRMRVANALDPAHHAVVTRVYVWSMTVLALVSVALLILESGLVPEERQMWLWVADGVLSVCTYTPLPHAAPWNQQRARARARLRPS